MRKRVLIGVEPVPGQGLTAADTLTELAIRDSAMDENEETVQDPTTLDGWMEPPKVVGSKPTFSFALSMSTDEIGGASLVVLRNAFSAPSLDVAETGVSLAISSGNLTAAGHLGDLQAGDVIATWWGNNGTPVIYRATAPSSDGNQIAVVNLDGTAVTDQSAVADSAIAVSAAGRGDSGFFNDSTLYVVRDIDGNFHTCKGSRIDTLKLSVSSSDLATLEFTGKAEAYETPAALPTANINSGRYDGAIIGKRTTVLIHTEDGNDVAAVYNFELNYNNKAEKEEDSLSTLGTVIAGDDEGSGTFEARYNRQMFTWFRDNPDKSFSLTFLAQLGNGVVAWHVPKASYTSRKVVETSTSQRMQISFGVSRPATGQPIRMSMTPQERPA